ncbi:CbtA family protein [Gluconobacter cerinus]|uniref:CbtA family protein n=1 Tax=Gluconobacter cerinus TaxID=38307 RepID=UPI001B8ADABD|nr:CbtA family protein [Gluconobacter cerinus]MBS0983330.1 CbtA family protein [Gluconobacter cerinus]
MTGRLLSRGMIAGIAAALLAFVFARFFGEPQVNLAIAFESAKDLAAGEPPEPEIISRGVQASFGLLTAAVMYGAAYGGIFATVFAFAYGRVGRFSPRALSALLAAAAFVVFVLVPDLKYPPNPPAVGLPSTIGLRTGAYFGMIALSLCAAAVSYMVSRPLIRRLGHWNGVLASLGIFIILVAAVQAGMPDINEVPTDFPATVLWRFREAALGMQIVLWATIGLLFGPLASRVLTAGAEKPFARNG